MSKRHNANRRRTYGRRLHEVHERHDRRGERLPGDVEMNGSRDDVGLDPLAFLDGRGSRTRFGFAD